MSFQPRTPRVSASIDEEKRSVDQEAHEPHTAVERGNTSPEITSDPEKGTEGEVKPAHAVEVEHEYITGIKLLLVMAAVTLTCFLMLLDTSIITTVCRYSLVMEHQLFAYHPVQGNPSNYQ
jgi:hypothetical protein